MKVGRFRPDATWNADFVSFSAPNFEAQVEQILKEESIWPSHLPNSKAIIEMLSKEKR